MGEFLQAMFDEMGVRRRRLREAVGDRGQGIAEFLVLAGLGVGSLGLFVRDWMAAAAPWGFAVPLVFLAGYVAIEARRQRAFRDFAQALPALNEGLERREWARLAKQVRSDADPQELAEALAAAEAEFRAGADARERARLAHPEAVLAPGFDRTVLLWSFGCALLGAAAFAMAWSAAPPARNPDENWRPPSNAVPTEIGP